MPTGLLIAPQGSDRARLEQLRVAGVPLAERQRRLLRSVGARPASCPDADPPPERPLLLLRLDRLCDRRLLQAALSASGPVAIVDRGGAIAALFLPQGFSAPASDLDECARRAGARILGPIDDYVAPQRRRIPPKVLEVTSPASARTASNALLADAQNGVLDWPARFLHPLPENALVRLLWRTPVTPNQVSALTFVAGLAVMAGFAAGWFWSALAGALVIGVLDGVDGKLARTRLQVTPLGEWEHLADKVLEYGWYVALAAGLVGAGGTQLLFLAALAAIAGMMGDVAAGGVYRNVSGGASLDDAGRLEAAWRLISGRRNTHMWMLVPFGLAGAWAAGLVAIAVSSQIAMLVKLMLVERNTRALRN